jgi:hypothetical protein
MVKYRKPKRGSVRNVIDDEIKKAHELMRTLDSPSMKMARQALEEQERLMNAFGGRAAFKQHLDQADRLREYGAIAKAAEQMSAMKAIAGMTSASYAISESIFGRSSMQEMAIALEKQNRIWKDSLDASIARIVEDDRRRHEQMSRIMEALGRSDWQKQLSMISEAVKGFDLSAFYARFEPIGRMAAEVDTLMRAVGGGRLAALELDAGVKAALEFRTNRLIRSYAGFTVQMVLKPETIVAAPPFVAEMPSLAVLSHARALRAIPVPREEEETEEPQADEELWSEVRAETLSMIDRLLPQVSPELAVSWKGGWNTARRQGDDWVRQSAASFRHVLITVLDIVAPPDRVKSAGKPEYLDKKGEVVRRGQAAWLCEPLRNKTYRRVVLADIESALTIIDAMSEAVHRADYKEIEQSFGPMAVRAAVTLRHILELGLQRENSPGA